MTRLSDDELLAYANWAAAECDAPLAALVRELQGHRAGAPGRLAVVILPAGLAAMLPHLLAPCEAPASILVVAPEGTTLPRLRIAQSACTLETYDPAVPAELRQRLQAHGLAL